MALDYAYNCDANGSLRCYNTHGNTDQSTWTVVNNMANCEGTYKPECSGQASAQGRKRPSLPKKIIAVATWDNFIDSPNATPKNNLIFGGAAVIGALVARKMIKKGDKDTNTLIGGLAGLAVGILITKFKK